jgi:hypothetical protein
MGARWGVLHPFDRSICLFFFFLSLFAFSWTICYKCLMRTFCLDSLLWPDNSLPLGTAGSGRVGLWLATAARHKDLRKGSIILTKPLTSSTSVYVSNSSYPSNLSPCPSFLLAWVIDFSPFIQICSRKVHKTTRSMLKTTGGYSLLTGGSEMWHSSWNLVNLDWYLYDSRFLRKD